MLSYSFYVLQCCGLCCPVYKIKPGDSSLLQNLLTVDGMFVLVLFLMVLKFVSKFLCGGKFFDVFSSILKHNI